MSSHIESGDRFEAFVRRERMIETFGKDGHPHGIAYEVREQHLDWEHAQGILTYREIKDGKPVVLGSAFGYNLYPYDASVKRRAPVFTIGQVLDRAEKRLATIYEKPQGVEEEVTQGQLLFAFVEGIRDEAFAYDDEQVVIETENVLGFEPEEEDIQPAAQSGDRIIVADKVIMVTPVTGLMPTRIPRKSKFDA